MKRIESADYVTYEIIKGERSARITLTRTTLQIWKQLYKDNYEEFIKEQLLESITKIKTEDFHFIKNGELSN